jgi:hypothetical protein
MKIGVVEFCTVPLVAPSQKTTSFAPFWPLIKWKKYFLYGKSKNLVMKVVGLGKMHIFTKNRVKIQKFAMEFAQTIITCVES